MQSFLPPIKALTAQVKQKQLSDVGRIPPEKTGKSTQQRVRHLHLSALHLLVGAARTSFTEKKVRISEKKC